MLGIDDEMLEKLGVYFVYFRLNDTRGVTFIQFVEDWMTNNGLMNIKIRGIQYEA